jgi:hypothetical protein
MSSRHNDLVSPRRENAAGYSFEDAEIGQKQGHRFGFHRRATIGTNSELAGATLFDRPCSSEMAIDPDR